MSKRDQNNGPGYRLSRPKRTYTSIAGAVSAILWGGAGYAQVAGNDSDALEEVVVSGLRHSIETSIETKKTSDSIVESITAEDIGKLPDQSIAESLARLPGLAAQRVGGRAQVISLRGMAPDFAVTLLNGRELVSTGDNRGVEYDQYPSELISAVTVYKTPDAALGAQGLSGTVDLQTLRPLDLKERVFVVNGRYEHNGNGALNAGVSGNGNRFSTSYANKLADGKIGLAINYAHLDSPEQEQHFGAWGYGSNQIPFEQAVGLLGSEVIATSSKEKRDAFMAVVDFQATDKLRSTVDLYYSKFDSKSTARGLLWESAGCAWSDPGTNDYCDGVTVTNPTITNVPQFGITMVTAGTFAGISAVEQSNYDTRTDKLSAIGWNNQLKLESWTLESDLSFSRVKRRGQTFEMYAGLGNYGDKVDNNFQFSAPPGTAQPTFKPGLDYADASLIKLSDPGAWGQDGFMRQPQVDDRLTTLRLSAIHRLSGWISAVETGM